MNDSSKVTSVIVSLIALVLAVMLGQYVAVGDYGMLGLIVLIASVLIYAIKVYQYTGIIVMAISMAGLRFATPFGAIDAKHLAIGMFCLGAVFELVRPARSDAPTREWKGGRWFYGAGFILFCGLYLWQYAAPVLPHEFNAKQSLKGLLEALTPFIVLLFWSIKSDAHVFRIGAMRPVLNVVLLLLVLHLAIRLQLYLSGASGFGPMDELDGDTPYQLFPFLGVSPYILRSLGPVGVIVGAFIAMSPRSRGHTSSLHKLFFIVAFPFWFRKTRGLAWTVVFVGFAGSVLSSGRGAVVLALVGFLAALFYYRKFAPLFAAGAVAVVSLGVLNAFPRIVEEFHPMIGRSVSMLVFSDERSEGAQSIASSTLWRKDLAERALDEWTSDGDLFMRGRGVLTFSVEDLNSWSLMGVYEGKLLSSLRTARAHIEWLEIALKFGLLGVILYFLLFLAIAMHAFVTCVRSRRDVIPPEYVAWGVIICLLLPLSVIANGGIPLHGLLGILAASRLRAFEATQLARNPVQPSAAPVRSTPVIQGAPGFRTRA